MRPEIGPLSIGFHSQFRCMPCDGRGFPTREELEEHQAAVHRVKFLGATRIPVSVAADKPVIGWPSTAEIPAGWTRVETLCAGGCGRPPDGPEALYCADCRHARRTTVRKYVWNAERDQILFDRYKGKTYGRAAEIAKAMGWPTWAIKKRAAILGLSHATNRKEWTKKETEFLSNHAGIKSTDWIARKLNRSETSVILKFKHLKISRRYRPGLTMNEMQLCFGMDHRVIRRWIEKGMLKARRLGSDRETQQGGDIYAVSEKSIWEFISNHPMEFRLDRVDQRWFMDVVLNYRSK